MKYRAVIEYEQLQTISVQIRGYYHAADDVEREEEAAWGRFAETQMNPRES